jgi:hypothetical protein
MVVCSVLMGGCARWPWADEDAIKQSDANVAAKRFI